MTPHSSPNPVRLDLAQAALLLESVTSDEPVAAGSAPATTFPPGYTQLRVLGEGSTGIVYEVLRQGSDRPVALKLWKRPPTDPAGASRDLHELDMLARLQLPHIPRVLDYGSFDGHFYIVTDAIDGEHPDVLADRTNMTLAERVALVATIAEVVESVHERGIIHRDLKPANIKIGPSGSVNILDLGLAVFFDPVAIEADRSGKVAGTLGYMSPEQARSDHSAISMRSDVYSLGALAYRIILGSTPHELSGTVADALHGIAATPPRTPRELRPDLPVALAACLAHAVEPQPARRYPSAASFAADLRRWLRGRRVSVMPPTLWQRTAEAAADHPLVATIALCLLIAGLSLAATFSSLYRLSLRPATVLVEPNRREWVKLLSVTNSELAHWDGPVSFAELLPMPANRGGGKAVLLAGDHGSPPQLRSSLRLLRADDPRGEPLWTFRSSELAVPPIAADSDGSTRDRYSRNGLSPWNLACADVFPDHPGEELIVTFRSDVYSCCCICILGLDGHVLYQAWHDGHIMQTSWLSGPRRLICVGVNSERSWAEYGLPLMPESYPIITFALSVDDAPAPGWISTSSAPGTVRPAWYRVLWPIEAQRRLGAARIRFSVVPGGFDPAWYVRPNISSSERPLVGVAWVLDADGNSVAPVVRHAATFELEPELLKLDPQWVPWETLLQHFQTSAEKK